MTEEDHNEAINDAIYVNEAGMSQAEFEAVLETYCRTTGLALVKTPQDMSLRELFDHVAIVNDAIRAALLTHPGMTPVPPAVGQPPEKIVRLVAPKGWYLLECRHCHEAHTYRDETVRPLAYAEGSWRVQFQRLRGGGRMTEGYGHSLVEAWENAQKAVLENHGDGLPE